MMRTGSMCSGIGGLDDAVRGVWPDAHTVWHAEIDPSAALVFSHRFPGVPNLGDIRTVDWASTPPVDIVTAGFPCQPASQAGRLRGIADPRWIWPAISEAIGKMGHPPRYVFLENVSGLRTVNGGAALGSVIHDLAALGYVGRYGVLRASKVGAPHQRARLFILATHSDSRRFESSPQLDSSAQ